MTARARDAFVFKALFRRPRMYVCAHVTRFIVHRFSSFPVDIKRYRLARAALNIATEHVEINYAHANFALRLPLVDVFSFARGFTL